MRGEAILLGTLYAGAILAFLAGVRRGLSFRTEGGPAPAQLATMASVWLAAFLALACIVHGRAISALVILALSYAVLMILDPIAARAGQAPMFFARLRQPQLFIAVASIVVLLANIWLHAWQQGILNNEISHRLRLARRSGDTQGAGGRQPGY